MADLIPPMVLEANTASAGVVIAIALLCSVIASRWRSNSLPYPPGPRPDPFIGNIRHMFAENQDQEFAKWGKQYGDVNYVKVFNQPLVILNSFQAAKDLLQRRGAIYSDRPRMVLLCELMGWGGALALQSVGPRFRKHRRLFQEHFSMRSLVKFAFLQKKEVYTTLSHMGSTPEVFLDHIKRFSAGMALNITYGYTVKSHNDRFISIADEAATESGKMTPAAMLVDFFPILKYVPAWMPFMGFKRHALYTRILVQRLFDVPYEYVKKQIVNGTASPCIAADLLETLSAQTESEIQSEVLDDTDIRDVTGFLYAAATDATGAVLSSFFLFMVLHEDVFKKAQAEIDQRVGNDRLIDFDDRESLPYLACVMREVLRLACPLPLGVPHRVAENDHYRNQFIPKDSTVIANAWAMTRNEKLYPEPYKFMPERFVDRMNEEAALQIDAVFGFGRRACPGKGFAEANIWLLMSNIIAMFSIEKAMDDTGKPITPPADYTGGIIRHPKAFNCKIRYRSDKARGIVTQANLLHN